MFINKSLSYLEQCVLALARKDQEYIPYRQVSCFAFAAGRITLVGKLSIL